RPVRRTDLQQHAVVLDYADVVFRHPTRHPREHLVPVGEYHGVEPVPAHPGDRALGLDEVTLRHSAILLIALAAASGILRRERARSRAVRLASTPSPAARTGPRSGIPRGGHCPEARGTCHTSRHLGRTASRGVLNHRHVPRTAAGAPPAVEVEVLRSKVPRT